MNIHDILEVVTGMPSINQVEYHVGSGEVAKACHSNLSTTQNSVRRIHHSVILVKLLQKTRSYKKVQCHGLASLIAIYCTASAGS